MTTEAINDFAKAVQADEEMARGLVAAIGQKQGGDAVEAFAAYAQEQGFAVTREDAEALQMAARARQETLSDDELEGVAGGADLFTVGLLSAAGGLAMVATVGTMAFGGATKAIVNETEKWRI